ncbi:adenosylmethionine--8-amino-7-oxononanoate transaminase [Methanococcus maripaludis]|uniref:Adenosylmethionine-8-amino-7-oxononanoate aminotransferase n=1 Tax=Methanococcus maripaludis OS7 TaxID=637915 RepID=A0A2Z5PG62_METMI|nr:adenosylmethionine--8-amino-7-oxononanoate transaminase [Methanococcus maripaludis]BAP63022.1 adenosylmethionine-8-amino-7-oxononanoate aminotransferase [Methanococcus maripaludis OS7]
MKSENYSKNDLEKWDKEYVWHPFTQMKEYREGKPLLIESGEGIYLIDVDGKKYMDAVSSVWCNFFGHSEKRIADAISKQALNIGHSTQLGCGNVPSAILAKRYVDFSPDQFKKVFFSEDGAEAIEIAVKMAFEYCKLKGFTNKTKFVSVKEGYHGDTVGAMSVGGSELFHGCFEPLLFEGYHASAPYCYRCKYCNFKDTDERNKQGCEMKCLKEMEDLIRTNKDEIFCVILEAGVMGSAGMIPYPKGYIEGVAKICKELNIILILDEIATFGRLGRAFYSDMDELKELEKPDILCLGKGITGGYLPLALTLATDEIHDAFLGSFDECKQLFHGHTYAGNQIICASAIETLHILEETNICEEIRPNIKLLHENLDKLKEFPCVGDIRKSGYMIGIELVKNKETKEPYDYGYKAGYKVAGRLLEKGIYIRPIGNTLIFVLPLIIKPDEIELLTKKIYESISELISEKVL